MMINISDKTKEELNIIIQKYEQPLLTLKNTELYPFYAVIINIVEPILIKKYEIFNAHWKAIIILFLVKNINDFYNQKDVENFIIDFEKYYKDEYQKFLTSCVIEDEFERDFIFIKIYLSKKTIIEWKNI